MVNRGHRVELWKERKVNPEDWMRKRFRRAHMVDRGMLDITGIFTVVNALNH